MTSSLIDFKVFEHCLMLVNFEISKLFSQQVLFTKCLVIADFHVVYWKYIEKESIGAILFIQKNIFTLSNLRT